MTLDRKIGSCGSTKMIPIQKVDDAAGGDGDILEWIGLVKRMILPPHIEEEIAAAKRTVSSRPPVNVLGMERRSGAGILCTWQLGRCTLYFKY